MSIREHLCTAEGEILEALKRAQALEYRDGRWSDLVDNLELAKKYIWRAMEAGPAK